MKTQRPPDVDCICFDLDNTLYSLGNGLWQVIDSQIQAYVSRFLGVPLPEARRIQKHYWHTYGTTLAGLMAEHGAEPGPYLAFVHDFDVTPFVQPNAALQALLAALPQRKIIFTNASAQHARNVLAALGVTSFFQQIIGVEAIGFVPKPDMRAYERCLAQTGILPERSMFLDDMPKNLKPAKALGMTTVLVNHVCPEAVDFIDYCLAQVEELAYVFQLDLKEGGG
jgi:putative hydrolase of the HAD superfamily